jgi:sugar-specific transcriptional regulator TrmB
MKNIETALTEYGLEPREINIYLFLLENQDKPAYKIAKDVGIPRATVYKLLESLIKKGLSSSWIKNGVKHFSAENPEVLRRHIDERKNQIEQVLPELSKMFSSISAHPSAKLYEGKEGVKQVFEYLLDTIRAKKLKRIYAYTDHRLTEQFPKFFRSWRIRKNKTGAFTYLIVPHYTPMSADYSSDQNRETRILSTEFPFDGAMDICGSVVAFFSFKDKEIYSITIDSKIIADMLTQFFMYMWSTLKN